jgi:PAS domain S-box-containing protein
VTLNNQKYKVLVVDDDGDLRPLIEQSLESAGYLTASVKSSKEAIDWLNENQADLMLLDYLLPDMTGEKLVDALSDKGLLIPFVVVTGRGTERVAVDLMKRGALDYLIKGSSILELLPQVVAHAFGQLEQRSRLAETEKKTKRLELLGSIAKAAGSALEPLKIFKAVVSEIRRIIPCERYVIATVDTETGWRPIVYLESDIDLAKGARVSGETNWWFSRLSNENQVLVVDDLRELSFPRAQVMAKAGFRSHLVVPILHEGQFVAYLGLMSTKVAAFTEEHKDLLASIALLLSTPIQNAMLHKESEERARRLEISSTIAKAAGSALEPKALFKTVVEEIRRVVPCERCLFGITSSKSGITNVWHIESDIEVKRPVERGEAAKIWGHDLSKTPQVVYHPDIISGSSSPRTREMAKVGFRSVLRVPIINEGEYQAHIGLASTRVDGFTEEQIELLVSVADHLGPVVRNATLYQESEERGRRLAALVDVARSLTQGLDRENVLNSISGAAAEVFGGEAGFRIREGDYLVRMGTTPLARNAMPVERILMGEGISGRVAESGEAILLADSAADERATPVFREAIDSAVTGTMMCVPIKRESDVLGTLHIWRSKDRQFSEDDLQLAYSLADQTAIAIENASLYSESERQTKRLAALLEVAKSLTRELNLDDVLNSIVGEGARIFGGEALFRLKIGDELVISARSEGIKDMPLKQSYSVGESAGGLTVEGRAPRIIPDIASDENMIAEHKKVMEEWGLGTIMQIPLIHGEELMGFFAICQEKGYVFADDEVELAMSLADQASIAIENARLHEEAMKSLQFFRSVVDDNSDAIVVRDLDYKIIHWNRGAEKIFGYTQEEALGKSAKMLYPEGEWEDSSYRERTNRGENHQREAVRIRKDGSSVPVIAAASPVKNHQGQVIAVSVVFKDLTEQKRTETELIEQENRLRTIVNNAAGDGIITIDEMGIVESINPSAQEIFGYMPEEIEGKNILLLMPAPYKEAHDKSLRDYLKTGVTNIIGSTSEVSGRRKDGSEFPMDLTVTEIWARGKRVFTGIIRDLSERKQAEKERSEYIDILLNLNELTQKMNTSLDLEEVLDLILDSTKSLLNVSDVSITSRDGECFVSKARMGDYFTSRNARRYELGEGGVGEAAQRGSMVFIENVLDYPGWRYKDDARMFNIITCLCVPLKNVDGVVIGVLTCLTREARRYSAGEFELIDSFANMAAIAIQNAENHSNLKNTLEELRKSQEMIVRAEKLSSLGTLAAGAAHEILNPAGVIQLRAEIIAQESPEGELVNQSADVIVQSVGRIKGICDDLRRFSRNEVTTREPFDPLDALASSISLIEYRLSPANIELNMNLGSSQPIVIGDPNQIQQVLLNLISNAIDAMPDGGKMSISSSEVEENNELYWEVKVADTGVGISKEDITQIFDPFFTTKSPDEGTGLGLSVLHGIVENHGGEVFVESEEGKGATFIVRLPIVKDQVGL